MWALFQKHAPRSRTSLTQDAPATPLEALQERAARLGAAGADLAPFLKEQQALHRVWREPHREIAVFGLPNVGKSTLIRAFCPGASVHSSPVSSAEYRIERHIWRIPELDETVCLVDLPGVAQVGRAWDEVARDHALRAICVIYVCASDLTAEDETQLKKLIELNKPMLVAFNKSDLYTPQERQQIVAKLGEIIDRLTGLGTAPLQLAVANVGGSREITRVDASGNHHGEIQRTPPYLDEIWQGLAQILSLDAQTLAHWRQAAILTNAEEKLDLAQQDLLERRIEQCVHTHVIALIHHVLAEPQEFLAFAFPQMAAGQLLEELVTIMQIPLISKRRRQALLTHIAQSAPAWITILAERAASALAQNTQIALSGRRGAVLALSQGLALICFANAWRALNANAPELDAGQIEAQCYNSAANYPQTEIENLLKML
ncbi:GTPase [Magnetofaba australis]|uniref:G domain-containing protein n=1 Tax=Magnetofaba australis IT-1 TaxID=1434232 RepID=W0LJ22_9PROT|nr:GTPase domain-containing protein [Magnetofaba australis]AHG23898.1 hypothetical protein MIIT1_02805 [Magnetofaba australis IT-1]OSM08645.1 hypothetical protein MAIT1_02805 [Magnetofaba australis IT-1]